MKLQTCLLSLLSFCFACGRSVDVGSNGQVSSGATYAQQVQLQWVSPADGSSIADTVTLALSGAGVVNVEIFANGVFATRCTVAPAGTSASCSLDTTVFDNGPIVLSAHGWNSPAGTAYTEDADAGELNLTVANTPGVHLAWASPTPGTFVSGTASLKLTGREFLNVEVFSGDAMLVRCNVSDDHHTATATVDTTLLPNGPLSLIAHGWDSPAGTPFTSDATTDALSLTLVNGTPPVIPSDTNGIQARRIADMLETFGADIYFNGQDGASGDTVDGIAAATRYIVGDSGLNMMYRGYADSVSEFETNGPALFKATGGTFSLCMGIGNTPNPQPVIDLATASVNQGHWIRFIEGGNEPNTNFGAPYQTWVDPATEAGALHSIYNAVHRLGIAVAAPSVVGDYNGIKAYWGASLAEAVASSDLYNTHLYPNHGGPNGANQMHDWSVGVSENAWGGKGGIMTEWQPVLYNGDATDDASAAYWTPIALLSGYVDFNLQGLFWWEMFDYAGFNPHVGLFHGDASNPYPAAKVLKAMFALTGDTGTAKHAFTPGKLDISVAGLPAGSNVYDGGRYAVFQNSSGTFFVFIWNEQNALDTSRAEAIHITFNEGPVAQVTDYSLTNPVSEHPTAKQVRTNVSAIDVNLTTEVRVLQVVR